MGVRKHSKQYISPCDYRLEKSRRKEENFIFQKKRGNKKMLSEIESLTEMTKTTLAMARTTTKTTTTEFNSKKLMTILTTPLTTSMNI